jgi:cytochrome b
METRSIAGTEPRTVKVWDSFVRVFHWCLVVAFFAAYFLEGGDIAHEVLGYIALGLVAARIVWGFTGTEYARFSQFVPSPHRLIAYVRDALRRREAPVLGHNPAGAVMILALICAVIATGVTGWMLTTEAYWGDELIEELHELIANLTVVLVGLHVAGAIYESIRHRENLILAMITGCKRER